MTLSITVALWALTLPSAADSRKAISIGQPGQYLVAPGANTNVNTFSQYSYGLGGVGRASAGGAGALSSSMGQLGGGYSTNYSNLGAGGAAGLSTNKAGAPLPMLNSALSAPRGGLGGMGELLDRGGDLAKANAILDSSVVSSAMAAIQSAGSGSDLKQASAVTTLVPATPGVYHDFMENGEKAFRSGYFLEAMQAFRNANHIGVHDPESLLSLAHAHFALGGFATAGVYLAQAIEVLPELPLLPIKPTSFYGNLAEGRSRYGDHLEMLRAYLQRQPDDAEAHLLLAYFLWFSQNDDPASKAQDIQNAKQSLAAGLAASRKIQVSKATVEAIETFWDGMVASGQAAGRLERMPTSSPATTAPASDAGKPSTQPAARK
jgi:tetratricopeptide (TPR) repeat protein